MDRALRGIFRSASGVFGSLLVAVLTTKWIALTAGAAGLGLYGQLRNFQQSIVTFTTLNGQTAFIQGVASRDGEERNRFIAVVGRVLLILAVAGAILVTVAAEPFARLVFGVADVVAVRATIMGGLGALFYTASSIATFVLSGEGRLAATARVQVAGALGVLLGAVLLIGPGVPVTAFGGVILIGGLVSALAGLLGVGPAVLASMWRGTSVREMRGVLGFLGLSAALAIGGAIGVGARTLVRGVVVGRGGLDAAGYFEAGWTISMTYMGLLLSSLGGYLLPALSRERSNEGRSRAVDEFLRIAIACGVPLIAGMVLLRGVLVRVLYSSQVLPATDLIGLMVLGDYLKLVSWVLVMPMLSAADGRSFIRFEVLFNGIFLAGVLGLPWLGVPVLEAVGVSFALGYLWNAIAAWRYFHRDAGLDITPRTKRLCAAGGLALVGLVGVSRLHYVWLDVIALIPIVALSVLSLGREGWRGLRSLAAGGAS